MVVKERKVDLRENDRQTKELSRIADRVRKIAIRDFPADAAVAVLVTANKGEVEVRIGAEVEEEVIEAPKPKPRKKATKKAKKED